MARTAGSATSTRQRPSRLTVTVENPADADRPASGASTGMGLENVRQRLRALFAADASVHWHERDGRWRVEVALPAVRAIGTESRAGQDA